ncbi:MAG: DNA invertase Pin-like site-specific DNA recombinase [Granulosicoccus sp.]|jgi:DNA invertase Pin-like site-specific DNA recombinase
MKNKYRLLAFLLLLFSCLVTAKSDVENTTRQEMRELADENMEKIQQYMEKMKKTEPRLERISDMVKATNNYDAAVASVAVFPASERDEANTDLDIIFMQFSKMLLEANRIEDRRSNDRCRRAIDEGAQPAYQKGLASYDRIKAVAPATTNKEQIAVLLTYTLFFSTVAYYPIPMALIMCTT